MLIDFMFSNTNTIHKYNLRSVSPFYSLPLLFFWKSINSQLFWVCPSLLIMLPATSWKHYPSSNTWQGIDEKNNLLIRLINFEGIQNSSNNTLCWLGLMVFAFSYYFYYFEKNAKPYQALSRKHFPQLPLHQKQLIHMLFSSPLPKTKE